MNKNKILNLMPNTLQLEKKRYIESLKLEHPEIKPIIIEEPDANIANQLLLSGEFRQPEYSERRNLYILIRKKVQND